jgi:hypothetical protein
VDAGGNGTGARILIQFEKLLENSRLRSPMRGQCEQAGNQNRGGCIEAYRGDRRETGLKITGLVNNTHMLRETNPEDILKGYRLCSELSAELGIPVKYSCCTEETEAELKGRITDIEEFNLSE